MKSMYFSITFGNINGHLKTDLCYHDTRSHTTRIGDGPLTQKITVNALNKELQKANLCRFSSAYMDIKAYMGMCVCMHAHVRVLGTHMWVTLLFIMHTLPFHEYLVLTEM